MMGGILSPNQAQQFHSLMEWDSYVEEENFPDDIKLTLPESARRKIGGGDADEVRMLITGHNISRQ